MRAHYIDTIKSDDNFRNRTCSTLTTDNSSKHIQQTESQSVGQYCLHRRHTKIYRKQRTIKMDQRVRSQQTAVLLLVASISIALCAAKDLPDSFDKCKRDSDFDKCLVDAVNKAIQILKPGNKDFGIPPLEPLSVKSLVIDAGTAPINLRQTLKNVLVTDMISTSTIKRYRTDLNKHLIICDSITDRIQMLGDYEMSGRILLLPITGSGRANITLVGAKIEHRLIGEPFETDGVKYMRLKEYRVAFDPKRVYMHFENLFNDATLSQAMNRFLNDNWETVFNELKVGYAKSFGQIFRELSNRIFEKVPMDSIFVR